MGDNTLRKRTRSVRVSGTHTVPRRVWHNPPSVPTQYGDDVEKLKSQVRSRVMRILTERLSKPAEFSKTDSVLVTELIVEYLEWMGYNWTLDTFRKECQLPEEKNSAILNEFSQQLSGTTENVLPRIFEVINMFKET